MRRILKNLFSDRNKDETNQKVRDIFTEKQLLNICRLMATYGIAVYGDGLGYRRFGPGRLSHDRIYDPMEDFLDKSNYKAEEWYLKNFNSIDDVHNYFKSCGLISMFDLLEVYCQCILTAAGHAEDFDLVSTFIEDLNQYLSENNIDYELINIAGKIEVRRKTLKFAEDQIINELPKIFNQLGFKKVEKEFNKALRHWTRGEFEDCIRLCNISLESTLTFIGGRGSGTESLYKDVTKKFKIPQIVSNEVDLVRKIIASIENLRSKKGEAHGGEKEYVLDKMQEVCELTLNLTGSIIIYLLRLYKDN